MFKKMTNYWKKDKTLFCMEGIGYTIILVCNIWIITRPLPPAEIAIYWLLMNLIGFLIGSSIISPILLRTIFKQRLQKMVNNFIEIIKK